MCRAAGSVDFDSANSGAAFTFQVDGLVASLDNARLVQSLGQEPHTPLDKAVDAAYGKKGFNAESDRVAFLFELYQKYLTPLLPKMGKGKKKRG